MVIRSSAAPHVTVPWIFPELIMAVGLVVDYMVHILHYYLHQASKPNQVNESHYWARSS